MSKKLDDALYQFADDGTDRKDEVLEKVMRKANSPVKSKIYYRKYAIAAVSFCLVITIIGNFNVIASSINKFLNTFFPSETIMINVIQTNRLTDIVDALISSEDRDMADAELAKDDPIAYQILYSEVEKPYYVYLYYYRGYLKAAEFDKQTKNIKEIDQWLRSNAGIGAMAAETPEEAAELFGGSNVSITPAKIREELGCMLPDYLPDGKSGGNVIQYNEKLSSVNITYFYKGKADFDMRGKINNYITLGITNTETKYSKNLLSNLAVTQNIKISQINECDVYISDGYYVWKNDKFLYVLYSTFMPYEEAVKIIENMR